ncbi:hypothetical protein ODZ84_19645 [Chryseobacterium fluminis]|uniref:hypothetical protein n=1 Tax=Chryseobacterium fluminis TaxID=2983606 RepID=UPI002258FEA5|nr:hypothetical protein [Chryseobacterium sp. MMS21-Ot14]UZT97375.1 hypothetical protein ODZ84_19645 [Chryseobacterium sp. MMS21-Ot14]
MAVYLPQRVYAVCTSQLSSGYKQFEISDKRPGKTVLLGSQNRVFLVKLDKKLSDDFTCKSGWSSGAGTVAFGGGVVGGMLLVAATAATVPVAGWIVGGIIAVAAIGFGIWQMMQSPTCSEMIGYDESMWKLYHEKVSFDKNCIREDLSLALTKKSMLACKEGGVLLPFISETQASIAASNIASNNRMEMGVNIGSGLIAGVLFGFSLGTALPAGGFLGGAQSLHILTQTAVFGAWLPIGFFIINPIASSSGQMLNSVQSDGAYQNVKGNSAESSSLIQPTDSWDPLSPRNDMMAIRNRLIQNNATRNDIAAFDAGVAEAERQGTYSLRENPQLREMITRMRNGNFGPELQNMVTNRNGNLRGMINERNINNVANSHSERGNTSIMENMRANRVSSATAVGGIITLIAPFVSNYFAEAAIRIAGESFAADTAESITVNANEG